MRVLIARANKLNRRIYSSLPWGFRLSNLIIKLSLDTAETFGRIMHQVFKKAGVEGLPPNERAYAKVFGKKAWKVGLAKLRNPEVVEAAASDLMMRWLRKNPVRPGASLKEAENLATSSLINAGKDQFRGKRNRREDQIPMDEEGVTVDLEDLQSFKDVSSPLQIRRLKQDIYKELGSRAVIWFDGQMAGATNAEIAEAWAKDEGLEEVPSHNSVFLWMKRVNRLEDLKAIISDHIKDAA